MSINKESTGNLMPGYLFKQLIWFALLPCFIDEFSRNSKVKTNRAKTTIELSDTYSEKTSWFTSMPTYDKDSSFYYAHKALTIVDGNVFSNLGEGILDTFNANYQVKIESTMDNLELDVATAVPIGLIVNELLTNALKYGKGNIRIILSQCKQDILTLKVADNGVGKVIGRSPKRTGFGTQIIQLLTQQLDGNMVAAHEHGTSVLFQFKTKPAA